MSNHDSPRMGGPKRILFLEAYDSFSNNIVALLKDALGSDVSVKVLHMDLKTLPTDPEGHWTEKDFLSRLASFDAVVCGPGPGTPLDKKDAGAFQLLWNLPQQHMVPVLGVCLGFQSLVAASGGKIRRLRRGMHGMVRDIEHLGGSGDSDTIFRDVSPFKATLYHSLCADIGQDDVPDDEWHRAKWMPSSAAPDLLPQAWVTETGEGGDERILMAVKHTGKPFWGLQYHPESVCTDPAAHDVLKNWFQNALKWNASTGRNIEPSGIVDDSFLRSPARSLVPLKGSRLQRFLNSRDIVERHGRHDEYHYRELDLPDGINATHVLDILYSRKQGEKEAIVLDSSSAPTGDALAKSSIIALDVSRALRFEHRVHDEFVTVRVPGTNTRKLRIPISSEPGNFNEYYLWHALTDFWRTNKVDHIDKTAPDCAFRGGFMGYVTYEAGLYGLSPPEVSKDRPHRRPDVCMAWVKKSIVLDHRAKKAYMQILGPPKAANIWLDKVAKKLTTSETWKKLAAGHKEAAPAPTTRSHEQLLSEVGQSNGPLRFNVPNSAAYEEDVSRCQEAIKAGDSYELCLTAQTTMIRPKEDDNTTWDMYKTLRARQPAPFGSYIRLGGATLLSSSPERFLQHDSNGNCSMRPMKGTVRKSDDVSTLAQAEKILHCPKEEAENLMIVDLVRHDLHAVCGAGKVSVPELLKVEEYTSVFQMVTVVNGELAKLPGDTHKGASGLQALGSMLPPGSMTGAPKKRSCEILKEIESRERSLYSGVVGYFDVTGQADWSVTIRSMFRWDDEKPPADTAACADSDEIWHIGAGGAVTILSTPEGEREEMLTKLCGPLGVFMDTA